MAHKGYKQTEEHVIKKSLSKRRGSFFYCKVCNKKFWRQPSAIKKGQCKFCSRECYQKWQKGKPKLSGFKLNPLVGNNNPNWRGGVTLKNHKIRNSQKYKKWRNEIFKRDNWTCQICGKRSKKNHYLYIQAHHKKPFATFPELRFVIDNGITLCKECHNKKPKGKEVYAITD